MDYFDKSDEIWKREQESMKEMIGVYKRFQERYGDDREKIRKHFASMSYKDMKNEIESLDTKMIEVFCSILKAVEFENYELCQAAQEVLDERNKSK